MSRARKSPRLSSPQLLMLLRATYLGVARVAGWLPDVEYIEQPRTLRSLKRRRLITRRPDGRLMTTYRGRAIAQAFMGQVIS